MAKISRNSPCPCGSGKKYKKCCIDKNLINENDVSEKSESYSKLYEECEALDNLSNSVVDFINKSKFDEAENACNELLELYPDQIDGVERFAMLYEARGDNEKAIEYYNKAVEFARSREGFDTEFIDDILDKIKELSVCKFRSDRQSKTL